MGPELGFHPLPGVVTSARACGKVILLGEHAVVYGQPALAVPVDDVHATATVVTLPRPAPGIVHIQAPGIGLEADLDELPADHPLGLAVHLTLEACGVTRPPHLGLRVDSEIPIASGLGSGAAVSVALIRALGEHLGSPLPLAAQSDIAFEVEKLHHRTPSGIDNTVVTYGRPVYFVKGYAPEPFDICGGFDLAIADSGHPASTGEAVAGVRALYDRDPEGIGLVFEAIGRLTNEGRTAIAAGDFDRLGTLMDQNQARLADLAVSTPDLERLVSAGRSAGALGAKLSGGGLGGNVIALLPPDDAGDVSRALLSAGAVRVISTRIGSP
jgi:mevalonate kinase